MSHSPDSGAINVRSSSLSTDRGNESVSPSASQNCQRGKGKVWTVAQSEHSESRTTPSWILNTTAKIIERYSPASGRVLILASSIPARPGNPGASHDDEAARRRGRQMIPLMEIAAVGARLGRRIEVRLHGEAESGPQSGVAGADRDSRPVPAIGATTLRKSVSGLPAGQPTMAPGGPAFSSLAEPSDFGDEDSDRFDAVIVIAQTPAPAVVPDVSWSRLLDHDSVLAAVTHGYGSGNESVSLGTPLQRSAAATGLIQIDRIPLLAVSIRRDALAPEQPGGFADHDGPPWPRRHADLFLFAMPGARETGARR